MKNEQQPQKWMKILHDVRNTGKHDLPCSSFGKVKLTNHRTNEPEILHVNRASI